MNVLFVSLKLIKNSHSCKDNLHSKCVLLASPMDCHHFGGTFRLALRWGVRCSKVRCSLERSCPWCTAGCSGTDIAHIPWQTVKAHVSAKIFSPTVSACCYHSSSTCMAVGGWGGPTRGLLSLSFMTSSVLSQNSFSAPWCWTQCTSQSSRFN